MKFRTLVLATAVLASATGFAFAQNTNRNPGVQTPDSSQPAGQMNGTMSTDKMERDRAMNPGTTGSGMSNSGATSDRANGQMLNKNVSPASPEAGEKQQK